MQRPNIAVLQLPLQSGVPENGIPMRVCGARVKAHTCSHLFRPGASVPYEHMFCGQRKSAIGQRALGALRLARAFLTLEDDTPVDWEVDEWGAPAAQEHPHRAPLRRPSPRRRPGAVPPAPALCISPVSGAPRRRVELDRPAHPSPSARRS